MIKSIMQPIMRNMLSGIFGDSGGATPAQEIYETASSLLSLRKLNASYTGQCIRVRRSNDNVETDIGFNNGVLDTAALLTFTGANSAFVTTIYNQITGAGNVTQTTAANQPRIVNAGVIDTLPLSGKPTLVGDGTQWLFNDTGLAAGKTATTLSVVGSFALLAGYKMLAGVANIDLGGATNIFYLGQAGIATTTGLTLSLNTPYVMNGNVTTPSTPAPNWVNGFQNPTSLSLNLASASRLLTVLGSRGSLALSQNVIGNGRVSEHIVTSSILSDTDRQIIEADQMTYYNTASQIQSLYASANSLFSLRKLNSNYAGQCIRIRRSNDNVETDIGFVDDVIDTTALLTFTGTNSAFVATWYDQSSNARHAVQATAANQPRIVNAGVVELMSNGKPSISADGLQTLTTSSRTFTSVGSILATVKPNFVQGAGIVRMWLATGQTNSNIKLGVNGASDFYRYMGMTVGLTGTYVNGTATIRSYIAKVGTNTLRPFKDGLAQTPASAGGTTSNTSGMALLGSPTDFQNWVGQMSELTYFDVEISDVDRKTLEAHQGAYFNITIATLPVAPVLATPTATDTTLALTWTMSNDTGVTDYVIQYKASSSSTWLTFSDGTSTAKTATITGLTANTSYDVRVNAVTDAGNGAYSNVQTISTSVSSFSPTSITGLMLWIDGNDASTITSSGGLISQINDKSGQNNHIVQGTGARQPTYDSIAKSINFDGGDWLDRASFGMFNNGSATCFVVTSDRVFVESDTLFSESGTSDYYSFCRLTGASSLTTCQIRVNSVTILNNLSLNGTTGIPTTRHIQTYKDTGSLITYYENGVAGSTPRAYTRSVSATMDRFALGGRIQNGADDRTINAKVYELLIYFGGLSNSDINLIGNYLNAKWSVSWTNL